MNTPLSVSRRLLPLVLVALSFGLASRAMATASVSATITQTVTGSPNGYSMTLINSSTAGESVNTFWFAWVPGQDYMAVSPTNITAPAGWSFSITGGFGGDGYAIRFVNQSTPLAAGASLSGFNFSSTSTLADLEGKSVFFPSTPVMTTEAFTSGDTVTFVVAPAPTTKPQTITFPAIATKKFGAAPFATGATASSGLPVSYTTTGPITIAGNTVTLTGVGSATIVAKQAGNASFSAAPSVSQSFTISKGTQKITFAAIPTHTFGDKPFKLSGKSSSGLALTYTVTGPAKVKTSTLTLTGAGAVTVKASQAGNADYAAATAVSESFAVDKAKQAISFDAIDGQLSGATVKLDATASSGLAVTYAVSGPATLTGTSLKLTGAGTVSVTASQAGSANYSAAKAVKRSFKVYATVQSQTITFSAPATVGAQQTLTLTATATSGLPITYTSSGPVTIAGTTATFTAQGTVKIRASQPGDSAFSAAPSVVVTIVVGKPISGGGGGG